MVQQQDVTAHNFGNIIRSAFLIVMLFAIVLGLAFAFLLIFYSYKSDWAISEVAMPQTVQAMYQYGHWILLGTLGWMIIMLIGNQLMISFASGSETVELERYPRVARILTPLAQKAGIPVPHLAIINTPELNAFASGMTKNTYTVTLTTGLMEKLNNEELAGVIAHELAHMRHNDVRLAIIAAAITGGIALMFELVMMMVWRGSFIASSLLVEDEDIGGAISGVAVFLLCLPLVLVAWFISNLANLALSRQREYMADAKAAEWTGNPNGLVSALDKISEDCDIQASSGVMAMCIDAPKSFISLLSTHPETEDRIAALQCMNIRPAAPAPRPVSTGPSHPLNRGAKPMFGQRGV